MRYEYFKIIDRAFVQALLEGKLYMNPLSYFGSWRRTRRRREIRLRRTRWRAFAGQFPRIASGSLVFISAKNYWT